MTDVLQSHSSRSVPVGFYSPPLHPCLVDLPLLLSRPVQHTVAQLSSLLGARDVEGWQLPIDWRVGLRLSFGVLYEPPVVSAACPHLRSSCVCWGRHHHHHGLASCLRNRLHHLYLGRRPPVHRFLHQYQHRRQLLASFEACPRRSLLHHPRSSWLLWPPSASSMPSSSEVSSSP